MIRSRTIDKIIILGSGTSINDLSEKEIEHINNCKTVIALNKFMAFYKKVNIIPTHIYFLDIHENSLNILNYIFSICIRDNLTNLTFILRDSLKDKIYSTKLTKIHQWLKAKKYIAINAFKGKMLRSIPSEILKPTRLMRKPRKSKVIFTTYKNFLEGGEWASTISPQIFHYRGSLSSVLNICSIIGPNRPIYLVGTDFNSNSYFFEKELSALDFPTDDFTTKLVKEHGKHFSAIEFQGTTIFDKFPFITNMLSQTNNELFCINKNSLIVEKGFATYRSLIDE